MQEHKNTKQVTERRLRNAGEMWTVHEQPGRMSGINKKRADRFEFGNTTSTTCHDTLQVLSLNPGRVAL